MQVPAIIVLLLALVVPCLAEPLAPLVLHKIMGRVPVEMQAGDKVGFMLINEGGKNDPRPRYIVGIAGSRTVVDTRDLELFKCILGRLPRGTVVTEYDSCTVPRSWGLKAGHYDAFYAAFDDLGLVVSEERRLTCTCDAMVRPARPVGEAAPDPAEGRKVE